MDPIAGAALAKAAGDVSAEGAKEAGKLLSRVLGPAADEIGEALRRYTAFRVGNVARIVENADRKGNSGGQVPPRVAHRVLEEGSYCDDELMAEYLGGVLAAGRTPGGRDDRAVVWSGLVARLSSLQIRAHFLLYREWAAKLRGRSDLNLGMQEVRKKAKMYVELNQFGSALLDGHDVEANVGISHTVLGLVRDGLLGDHYGWGASGTLQSLGALGPHPYALAVEPTGAGFELYGWAQGSAGMSPAAFVNEAEVFGDVELPRLTSAAFPLLPPPPGTVEVVVPQAPPLDLN